MDFLYGFGQVICIIGLLYGAYLSITYVERNDAHDANTELPPPESRLKARPDFEYDAVTTHVWNATHPDLMAK